MGWNDKLDAGLAHWVVCGKRGAAVRSGVAIASELVTVLAPGTAVVSAGAPTVEANLERLRLVQPAAGYVSRKVLKRVDAPETPAPIKAPALPKPPSLKTPVSAKLPLYFVNTDACGDRRALQEKQCAALNMVPRRVRAVTPTCAAYVAAQDDPARSPHMIPTDDVATGAGANAIVLSFLEAFRAAAAGAGDAHEARLVSEDDAHFPADFRARLAVLAEKVPAGVDAVWLWSSTYAESREQLGIPEPPGGHGAGAFYETWPRYARGAGGWKGALVITCQPGICLTTRRGAAKIADAIAAAMARERWQPFDVAMPTLGARSETDASLPRMVLAADLALMTQVTLKSVRAKESHKAAARESLLAAPEAGALLERSASGDHAADAALGEIITTKLKRAVAERNLVKQLGLTEKVDSGALANLLRPKSAPLSKDPDTVARATAFTDAIFAKAL